jgi:hypothetical protein
MTPVNVIKFNNPPQDTCGYCLERLDNGARVVAHEGADGAKHPMHQSCLKTSLVIMNNRCPFCQTTIDPSSLVSWEEKLVEKSKNFILNAGITNIAANTMNTMTRFATRSGLAILPQAASLIENMIVNDSANYVLLGLGCTIGVGTLATGGLVVGAFIAEKLINTAIDHAGIPFQLSREALIIGILSGQIATVLGEMPLISGSLINEELLAGLVAGTISLLQ